MVDTSKRELHKALQDAPTICVRDVLTRLVGDRPADGGEQTAMGTAARRIAEAGDAVLIKLRRGEAEARGESGQRGRPLVYLTTDPALIQRFPQQVEVASGAWLKLLNASSAAR